MITAADAGVRALGLYAGSDPPLLPPTVHSQVLYVGAGGATFSEWTNCVLGRYFLRPVWSCFHCFQFSRCEYAKQLKVHFKLYIFAGCGIFLTEAASPLLPLSLSILQRPTHWLKLSVPAPDQLTATTADSSVRRSAYQRITGMPAMSIDAVRVVPRPPGAAERLVWEGARTQFQCLHLDRDSEWANWYSLKCGSIRRMSQ